MSNRLDDKQSCNGQPLPRNVRVLGLASLLNDVASEMIHPLMPQFLIGVLGGNRWHLGIIEGVADSIASLLKLWSGAQSDRAGNRKGFVVFGYALATVARPLIGLVTAPWQLFIARVGDRVGKGIRTSPRDALIAESSSPGIRGRAFGFHRAMDHLGAAIGPLLATAFLWCWPGQLRSLFALTLLPGLFVLALLVFGLREPRPSELNPAANSEDSNDGSGTPGSQSDPHANPARQRNGNFVRYLLALFIFTLGNSSDAFLLVRAGELGIPVMMLPLLWFAFHVAKSGGNFWAGRLVDRIGTRAPILSGWLLYAGVYLGFAFATAAWHAWALFLSYAVFYAMTEPAEKKLVTQLVGPRRHGLAFGWYNFAIGISALPSSLIFGALYESSGPAIAFGWGAGLALLASTVFLSVRPAGVQTGQ
ncbi:MAG: MFS transporter [Planctomycetales bacterium]|nr:MFS transporter [Planctomycetales bacterium]